MGNTSLYSALQLHCTTNYNLQNDHYFWINTSLKLSSEMLFKMYIICTLYMYILYILQSCGIGMLQFHQHVHNILATEYVYHPFSPPLSLGSCDREQSRLPYASRLGFLLPRRQGYEWDSARREARHHPPRGTSLPLVQPEGQPVSRPALWRCPNCGLSDIWQGGSRFGN